jgi:hypothetical protein
MRPVVPRFERPESQGPGLSGVNVWDNPSAVADFFEERVEPVIAAEGTPDYKPVGHGQPVAAYVRPASPG